MRLLLKDKRLNPKGVDKDAWPPMVVAITNENEDVVRMLCEDGRFSIIARDKMDRRTTLASAARTGATGIVKILLEYKNRRGGLGMEVQDIEGLTAFDYGTISEQREISALLNEHGPLD